MLWVSELPNRESMMSAVESYYYLDVATEGDLEAIVAMVEGAQRRLREAGIDQWQNGYPNRERIELDMALGYGRVLRAGDGCPVAYGALTYDGESAYLDLRDGSWLTPKNSAYATLHRLCVAPDRVAEGLGRLFMECAEREASERVKSLRVDTHPDNRIMQNLLGSLCYRYCGTVTYESLRLAYEKLLDAV